ncbi:MAG TPA: FkbM family methyltransferase [Acidimicrobiales bacterium]|nr:FkbM family methyltransferase [Acidimicrobiales bacterium]
MKRFLRRIVPASARARVRDLVRPVDRATSDLLRAAGAPLDGALDCTLAANAHGVYCVPRSSAHRPACQAILRGGVWEPDTVALLGAERPSGDIVTAGAFFGDLLPALARSRRDGALVWAFEPNAENHRCAAVTVALNDPSTIRLQHAALGPAAGVADLVTTDAAGLPLGGGSHVVSSGDAAGHVESTPVAAIDDVVPTDRDVAAIHLDVEGFEEQALSGALRTIERCRPLLVVENVPSPAWFDEHLAPLGYAVAGTVHVNTVYRAGATPRP